jgi:hypothetical protein
MTSETTPEDKVPSCSICIAEIPVSEAISEEAVDYVVYFYGLECYSQWKKTNAEESAGHNR